MDIDDVLSRLDGVRGSGGKWVSKCPAHQDRSPSLAITENDGTILMHCFAGCSVEQITDALGIDLADLFPEKLEHRQPNRPRIPLTAAWRCVQFEVMVIMLAASDLAKGRPLSAEDAERFRQAIDKIRAINEAVYGTS
jgi:hypothetical protein